MKKLFSLLTMLFVFNFALAQLSTVKFNYPVSVGCEKLTSNDDLKSCFEKQFLKEIQGELKNYQDELKTIESNSVEIYMKYRITKEGEIKKVNFLKSTDKTFAEIVNKAIINVLPKLKFVKPATNDQKENTEITTTSTLTIKK